MQIKDLSVSVESLEDVRGGSTFVEQYVENHGVENYGGVGIGGSGPTVLTSSPVSVTNNALQANVTAQSGAASYSSSEQFALLFENSVFAIDI